MFKRISCTRQTASPGLTACYVASVLPPTVNDPTHDRGARLAAGQKREHSVILRRFGFAARTPRTRREECRAHRGTNDRALSIEKTSIRGGQPRRPHEESDFWCEIPF